MKKYVPSILKILGISVVLFSIYLFSNNMLKEDEIIYEKENRLKYVYDLVFDNEENKEYPVLETFIGSMTGYGPDCKGCSGITASGYDLRNGNITYSDEEFKEVRVVAADSKYKIGTIVRVNGLSIYEEPFLAVVLDRGGRIKDNLMDLAFDTEGNPLVKQIGHSKNITYEILRYGW